MLDADGGAGVPLVIHSAQTGTPETSIAMRGGPCASPDGYEGFFANQAEIDRFLDGLKKAQRSPSKSDS